MVDGRFSAPGAGVSARSGTPGTPASSNWLLRLLFGFARPPYPGVAELDPGDVDDSGHVWTGYLKPPPPERNAAGERVERLGICCSGGGIRAASFVLGGLQALRAAGTDLLQRADHITAVSGGGYTATGFAALIGLTREQAPNRAAADSLLQSPPPWAPAAPETVNLRNHLHYLAPDVRGAVWGVLAILYGAVRHLLPFVALVVGAGIVYGWVLTWMPHLVIPTAQAPGGVDVGALRAIALFGCVVPILLAIGLVAWRLFLERPHRFPPDDAASRTSSPELSWRAVLHVVLETWSTRLAIGGVAVGLALCAVPRVFSVIPDDVQRIVPALGPIVAGIPGYSLLLRQGKAFATKNRRGLIRAALQVVMYAGGFIIVLLGFLLAAYLSASRGRGPQWGGFDSAIWLLMCVAYLALTGLFSDEVLSALHVLYRERLSTAFIRFRTRVRGDTIATRELPWAKAVRFSTLDLEGLPKLAICASVQVADDVVPPGRYCGSFTFEQDWSGGPLTGYVRTPVMESAAGDVLTMPGMMTVAGAAFSPLMGRDTRPGFRFLMALFAVRLGMWLPNPRALPKATNARQAGSADPSADPSRFFDAPVAGHFVRDTGVTTPRRFRRAGWGYALAEALGTNRLGLPYVYVTDGGHWENLGLVELLRRGCTQIVCLDASEDPSPPLQALGDAIALARDELSVSIDIDVSRLLPGSAGDASEPRLAASCCATGEIHYPDGRKGLLVVAKNVLPADAAHDVRTFAGKDKRFPLDSTLNQFFDDLHFDAYRALGEHAGGAAAAALLPHLAARPATP